MNLERLLDLDSRTWHPALRRDMADLLKEAGHGARDCVVEEDERGGALRAVAHREVEVSGADADRYCDATRTFVRDVEALMARAEIATRRLYPPRNALMPHRMWSLLHPRRHREMSTRRQGAWEKARHELKLAYRAFRNRTVDLARYNDDSWFQREREAERHEVRVAALARADARVWACALDVRKHPRRLVIWATSMERADMPGNQASGTERLLSDVTAREVQAALERERAEHPGTVVEWGAVTRGTLGRRGDAVSAWAALTGVRIVLDPAPEPDPRATLQSRYGGSGSGFGTSSRRFGGYGGGGVGGGGDGGGGGGDGGGGG